MKAKPQSKERAACFGELVQIKSVVQITTEHGNCKNKETKSL
jgi:hypothetical protein